MDSHIVNKGCGKYNFCEIQVQLGIEARYNTIIDFDEVVIRIYRSEKVMIHRGC